MIHPEKIFRQWSRRERTSSKQHLRRREAILPTPLDSCASPCQTAGSEPMPVYGTHRHHAGSYLNSRGNARLLGARSPGSWCTFWCPAGDWSANSACPRRRTGIFDLLRLSCLSCLDQSSGNEGRLFAELDVRGWAGSGQLHLYSANVKAATLSWGDTSFIFFSGKHDGKWFLNYRSDIRHSPRTRLKRFLPKSNPTYSLRTIFREGRTWKT